MNEDCLLFTTKLFPTLLGRNITLNCCNNNSIKCLNNQIISINLNNFNLKGEIPTEISKLKYLNQIDLSENQLQGLIPIELNQLSNLISINISNNWLYGQLPSQLNLTSLKIIDFSSNKLTGFIPPSITSLPKLKSIFLQSNDLTGSIPKDYDDSIVSIDFSQNKLSGPIPKEIVSIKNLNYLNLKSNKFTAPLPPKALSHPNLKDGSFLFDNYLFPSNTTNSDVVESRPFPSFLMVSAIGGCVVFIVILFSLFSALARRVSGIKPKGPPKIIQIEGTTQLTENLLSDDDILEKTTLERLKQSTDSQDKQRSSIQTEEHFYVEHIKPKLESQYIQDMATRTPKTFKPRLSDMAVVHCTSVRDVNHESGKHLDSNRESKYLLPEQSRESKLLLPEHSRESRLSFNGPNRESFVASAHDPNRESLLVQRSSTPLSTSPQLDIFQNGFPDQICFFTNHINVQPLLDLIEYLYLPVLVDINANQPYTANSSVEINIEQDHIIQVYQHIYDGWCFGRNMTSGQEGYFPAYCTFPSHPTHLNIFYFSSTSPSPHILDYAYSLFPDRITVYSQTHQDLYPLFNAFDGTELFLVCGDVEFIQPVLEFAEGFAHERWPILNIHAIADE